MYERITDEDPYKVPMRIYPAVHYTMGGLWVDYNLMTNVPGLFVLGEANFSDHGANRLGASALMQGLADGYFVLPYTIADYLAPLLGTEPVADRRPGVPRRPRPRVDDQRYRGSSSINGTRSVDHFHRELGKIMWDNCGMARSRAGLEKALTEIPALREEFWKDVRVLGDDERSTSRSRRPAGSPTSSSSAMLMCDDALPPRGVAAAATSGSSTRPRTARRCATTTTSPTSPRGSATARCSRGTLHKEPLEFENVHLAQRSYK